MSPERTEVEIGFVGGAVVRCRLQPDHAETLERRFASGVSEPVSLATDRGPVLVDLRRAVYVRTLAGRQPVGFGG
jgi:hypothetical protein